MTISHLGVFIKLIYLFLDTALKAYFHNAPTRAVYHMGALIKRDVIREPITIARSATAFGPWSVRTVFLV